MTTATANGKTRTKLVTEVAPATNGAADQIEYGSPYIATVTITGTADLLFHRWNCEAVAEKSASAKGSKAKKTDDIESYCYRDDDDFICLPGEYLRGAIIEAAKFKQDPRSPRKSAKDLFKAAIIPHTILAQVMVKGEPVTAWEYEHSCRVKIQMAAVTRVRPAFKAGWQATFDLQVSLPQYISPALLHDVMIDAGRLVGVADFRPTYGRFVVSRFDHE